MMKLSQTLLFIVGSVAAFFITVISSAIIAYAFPDSSSLILTATAVSPELKIVEAEGRPKYELHIMNPADEVEVYCHEGTQPELHNHDGLYALHCYE
jgi:hypothetical protein